MNGVSENPPTFWSRHQYLITAILLSLLVWVISYNFVSRQEEQRFEEAAEQARQIAVFFERQVEGIIQYGDSYLKLVRREYLKNFDIGAVEKLMTAVPLNQSIASHITVMDDKAAPLLVSGHKIKPGVNAWDREYFQFQKNSSGDPLYISKPHRGRNSGKVIVRLVRRYEKPNGEFGGVIFLALEAARITEFFNAMKIGPKSSATLVGTDKYIRSRSAYGPKGPGQDISGSRIWRELEQSPVGLYRQLSVVDDITRYYAYRRLTDYPLVVAIGLSVEDFQQAIAVSTFNHYSIALLVTLLIVVIALYFSRQHQLLKQIAAKNAELEQRNREIEAKNMELQNQNDELERFNYTVSHDLKAPLVTIKGFVGLLQKDLENQNREAVTRDTEQINTAADRMAQLLNELLELSRVGRQMNPAVDRSLSELAEEALKRVAIQVEERGIEVRIQPDMPVVHGDPGRLLEVFQNLIDNAIKFMGEQVLPVIEIGARAADGEIHCYVRDNGIGIASSYQHRVFNLFDRLDPKVDGTGIGLALVKRIVEIHGGRTRLESEGEGRGCTFWVTFPDPALNSPG